MIHTVELSHDTDTVTIAVANGDGSPNPISVKIEEPESGDFRKAWMTVAEARELMAALGLAIAQTES